MQQSDYYTQRPGWLQKCFFKTICLGPIPDSSPISTFLRLITN